MQSNQIIDFCFIKCIAVHALRPSMPSPKTPYAVDKSPQCDTANGPRFWRVTEDSRYLQNAYFVISPKLFRKQAMRSRWTRDTEEQHHTGWRGEMTIIRQ